MNNERDNIKLERIKKSHKLISRFTVIQKIYQTILLTEPDLDASFYDQWYHTMIVTK